MDSVGEGGKVIWTHTEKNTKHIGFLSNTGPGFIKNDKSYQASIQCWVIIGTQAFCWRGDDDLLIVLFGYSHQRKKKRCKVRLPLANFLDLRMNIHTK